jgi:hypothetical protein
MCGAARHWTHTCLLKSSPVGLAKKLAVRATASYTTRISACRGLLFVVELFVRQNNCFEGSQVMDSTGLEIRRRGRKRKYTSAFVVENNYEHRSLGAIGR